MNRTKLRKIGWISGLALLAVVIISAMGKRESAYPEGVLVTVVPLPSGQSLMNENDVLDLSKKVYGYQLESQSIGQIDVKRLEEMLETDPFVRDADVYLDARNKVNILIRQREPVLRIIDNNGLNYYLDKDGMKMPLSKRFTAHVLVATGNIPPYDPTFMERKRNLLKDVFLLSEIIRGDDFFRVMTEQLYVSNRGEFTLVPKIGDHKIMFGHLDQAEEKLRRLKIFYQQGMPYEGWKKYRTLDVRFKGQVIGKKR
jgi:cell division protein FtsQ